ncbi:MAG: helix-turn-helix domain-containing protein [Clostridia bacterium]|nr:helix-turn-helix domain-containing protein [Clostridia bacterium]MDE7208333.1 helix-turn-helix domain-containing protein [Clostridia bacterium]
MKDLGKALKFQRKINNYSQKQLANILGIKQTTLSNWEIGRNEPPIGYLIALADLYDISLDELVERDYYGRL